MNQTNNITIVDDLPLAAFLVVRGESIQGMGPDPSRTGHAVFMFSNKQETMEAIMKFYGKKAVVEPRGYLSAIRRLKKESRKKWNSKAKSKNCNQG